MYTQAEFLAIVWTLWFLGLATTGARIVLRLKIHGRFHLEDYLALLAFVLLTGLTAVVTVAEPIFDTTRIYLLASAVDPLTPLPWPAAEFTIRVETSLKLMFAQMLLFWSTLWAGKFSLLVFFRHIIIGIPRYLYIWWGVFTLVLLTYLGCMLSNFLTCVPLHKYWSATGCSAPEDLKRSDSSIKFATGADIAADFLIMFLPLRLILTLRHISMKQKLGLGCLFSLGIIVIIFAFVRLSNVTKVTAEAQSNPTTLANGSIILSLWSTIEAAVAVIVANLPAFRPLLRKKGKAAFSTGNGQQSGHTIGSKPSASESGFAGSEVELESLHSIEQELGGKARARGRESEVGDGDVAMTTHVPMQVREGNDSYAVEAPGMKLNLPPN